jgi:glycosyltransferase involved in cell wall biosynthesis
VLDLFKDLLEVDNSYILYLLTPGYESLSKNEAYIEKINNQFGENIKTLNKSNKQKLSKIIGESLCLIGPPYEETFGCVYQEAYYFNTPVILDKRCGGSLEIVSDESVIDFDNKDAFIERVLNLKKNREIVSLNNKFHDDIILKEWNGLFNI